MISVKGIPVLVPILRAIEVMIGCNGNSIVVYVNLFYLDNVRLPTFFYFNIEKCLLYITMDLLVLLVPILIIIFIGHSFVFGYPIHFFRSVFSGV